METKCAKYAQSCEVRHFDLLSTSISSQGAVYVTKNQSPTFTPAYCTSMAKLVILFIFDSIQAVLVNSHDGSTEYLGKAEASEVSVIAQSTETGEVVDSVDTFIGCVKANHYGHHTVYPAEPKKECPHAAKAREKAKKRRQKNVVSCSPSVLWRWYYHDSVFWGCILIEICNSIITNFESTSRFMFFKYTFWIYSAVRRFWNGHFEYCLSLYIHWPPALVCGGMFCCWMFLLASFLSVVAETRSKKIMPAINQNAIWQDRISRPHLCALVKWLKRKHCHCVLE